jgi:hypothetical protein
MFGYRGDQVCADDFVLGLSILLGPLYQPHPPPLHFKFHDLCAKQRAAHMDVMRQPLSLLLPWTLPHAESLRSARFGQPYILGIG